MTNKNYIEYYNSHNHFVIFSPNDKIFINDNGGITKFFHSALIFETIEDANLIAKLQSQKFQPIQIKELTKYFSE